MSGPNARADEWVGETPLHVRKVTRIQSFRDPAETVTHFHVFRVTVRRRKPFSSNRISMP